MHGVMNPPDTPDSEMQNMANFWANISNSQENSNDHTEPSVSQETEQNNVDGRHSIAPRVTITMTLRTSLRRALIYLITLQLMFLFFITTAISPYVEWKDSPEFEGGCEVVRNQLFRQRWNTISNIPFLFVGEIVLFTYFWDKSAKSCMLASSNLLHRYPIWCLLYGIVVCMMGVTSFWFHASLTDPGHDFDVASILNILLYFHVFLFAQTLMELPCLQEWILNERSVQECCVAIFLLLCGLSEIFAAMHLISRKDLLIQSVSVLVGQWLVLFTLCLVYDRKHINWKSVGYGVAGFLLIGLGYVFRQIESKYCTPESSFQFHALFHVLVAFGLLGLFVMLRLGIKLINNVEDNHRDEAVSEEI